MVIRNRYFAIGVGYPSSNSILHREDRTGPYLFSELTRAKQFIVSDEMRNICNQYGYGQDEMHVIRVEVLSNGQTVL